MPLTGRVDDTNRFTGFRGYLAYNNPGHRFDGVPTAIVESVLGRAAGVGMGYSGYWSDFYDASSELWRITNNRGGTALFGAHITPRGQTQEGGILLIRTTDVDNDYINGQLKGAGFRYRKGRRMWVFTRLAPQTANDGEIAFGLASATENFVRGSAINLGAGAIADGIYIAKNETQTRWDLVVRQNGVETRRTQMPATALANDVYQEVGFHINKDGSVQFYVDGAEQSTAMVDSSDANIPDDTDLTLSIGLQTGAVATRDLMADWIVAIQEN